MGMGILFIVYIRQLFLESLTSFTYLLNITIVLLQREVSVHQCSV